MSRRPSFSGPAPRRDPANELYDRACDVLAAAESLVPAARAAGTAPAAAAALGCLQASLHTLADATEDLGEDPAGRLAHGILADGRRGSGAAAQTRRSLELVARRLREAGVAAGSAREHIGPSVAELTAM